MKPHERLELEWAKFNDLDPVGMVACASGSSALLLGLEALQLPRGSEVILPDYTMVACPRAAVMADLVPVLVDCGDDLLMDIDLIEPPNGYSLCEEYGKIEVVMLVHVYGRRSRYWKEVDRSAKWGMSMSGGPVQIEDLAEAHGIKPYPKTDVACWSFFSNKIVAGAEGGAVWFRDNEQAKLARQLRCLGFTDAHDYDHIPRGWNSRLSDMHADYILSPRNVRGLWNYEQNKKGRENVVRWYEEFCPEEWKMPKRDAVWVYDIRIPSMSYELQTKAVKALNEVGMAARHGFRPMSSQQEFKDCRLVGKGNASRLAPTVMYLPVQPESTTKEDCRKAFEVLRRTLG